MSFVRKEGIDKNFNVSNELSHLVPSANVQGQVEEAKIKLPKPNKQKEMLKLIRHKQVRAMPGGYYTGLINDMYKDYQHFHEKGTFLQMEYLNPLIEEIKQTSDSIDRLHDERKLDKFQAPITLNSLSIQCTLPSDCSQLENLSPLSFLTKYTKPSIHRQQTILKLIRKIQRDTIMDLLEAKEIVFEYFNHYKTHEMIDEFFHFLDIQTADTFQSQDLVLICCYAERYFLHQLAKSETVFFKRSLQEIIDWQFLKRKLVGYKLNEKFLRFMKTLDAPEQMKNVFL